MTDYPTSGNGFLAESDSQSIEFANPEAMNNDGLRCLQQKDMLEALTALSPRQRTELVTDWYLFWINVHQGMRMVE